MPIDVDIETVFLLSEANAHWKGKPVSRQAWLRRTLAGIKVGGRLVKLDSVMIGRERFTSTEALARFIQAMNEPRVAQPTVSPSQRKRSKDNARELVGAMMK